MFCFVGGGNVGAMPFQQHYRVLCVSHASWYYRATHRHGTHGRLCQWSGKSFQHFAFFRSIRLAWSLVFTEPIKQDVNLIVLTSLYLLLVISLQSQAATVWYSKSDQPHLVRDIGSIPASHVLIAWQQLQPFLQQYQMGKEGIWHQSHSSWLFFFVFNTEGYLCAAYTENVVILFRLH